MRISSRELILGVITGAVVLFGITFVLLSSKVDYWQQLNVNEKKILNVIKQDMKMVEQKEKWDKQFIDLKDMLPQYPRDKKVGVFWVSIMNQLAAKHGVKILKHKEGQEKQHGEVYELPIMCREWEGNLDSVVHFLFDLQSKGAMLDIRFLRIRPRGKDVLKGEFSLYCAYTRGEVEESEK